MDWFLYDKGLHHERVNASLFVLVEHLGTTDENFSVDYFIGNFFRRKLQIYSHLLEKTLMESFVFCGVCISANPMLC